MVRKLPANAGDKSLRFNPWVRKIPWGRAWQPTLVFLPRESKWTEEPSVLQSIGLHTVGHDQSALAWQIASVTSYACLLTVVFIPLGCGFSIWKIIMLDYILKKGEKKLLCCCCSVANPCQILYDRMDCNTPGSPVLHHLPELAKTHVHWVGVPSSHLILCRPLLLSSIFPRIRVYSNESTLHIWWPNYWSFSVKTSVIPMNIQDWFPLRLTGLISL